MSLKFVWWNVQLVPKHFGEGVELNDWSDQEGTGNDNDDVEQMFGSAADLNKGQGMAKPPTPTCANLEPNIFLGNIDVVKY